VAVQGAASVRPGAKVKVRWNAEDAVIMAVDQ
jgi:spermidine/putrescine transport system ATP-binding protein/putrescine transport system ATP-binding protein